MSSKKMPNAKSSNYYISLNNSLFTKDDNYIGKLRSNFFGTEFTLFDSGVNPSKENTKNDKIRNCLALIKYEANILGFGGPRKMRAVLSGISMKDEVNMIKDVSGENILIELSKNHDSRLIYFKNKQPVWNEKLNSYGLDFNGRVKQGSVKNFQLCDEKEENFVYIQFGRLDESSFSMDFKYPLTPIQAFGISLSSIDKKIVCD